MSFMLTTEQIENQTKTVTRRNGWRFLNLGERLQPIVKGQGLRKGEKIERIGAPITVISIRQERLDAITEQEVVKEGFPEMSPTQFIEMYCNANKCKPDQQVTRIEFDWLPLDT